MIENHQPKKNKLVSILSFAGWGIGLASLLITIYVEFIREDRPKLEYDVVSSTKFINDKETSTNLRIFVDTLDVQANHLNISAYNIKVENKGSSHIRYDDYDKGGFGLVISNGTLLEKPVLIDASNDHLKSLYPQVDTVTNDTFVNIPHLSLDSEDYYVIRAVVLHKTDSIPRFSPTGKIVGQKEIRFKTLNEHFPGFWNVVFSGNWLVHIVRSIIYIVGIVVLTLLVALLFSKADELISKKRRKRFIAELLKDNNLVVSVCEDYIEKGEYVIFQMQDLFKKEESELSVKYNKSKGFINSRRALEKNNREALRFHNNRYGAIKRMLDKGYFSIQDNGVLVFNQEAKQTVQTIYSKLDLKR